MDLTDLTRDNLDQRLRVEFGTDVLGGRWPPTRMVLFDRGPAMLAVVARRRRADEDWLGPIIELVFLARVLRPRGVVLGFPDRSSFARYGRTGPPGLPGTATPSAGTTTDHGHEPDEPAQDALRILQAERSLWGPRLQHREHPVQCTPDLMPVWSPVQHHELSGAPRHLMQLSLRRMPGARPRPPALVARLLVEDGHRMIAAPWLADRLAGSGVLSAAPG